MAQVMTGEPSTLFIITLRISPVSGSRDLGPELAGLNSLTVSLGLAETKMISMTPYTSSVSVGNRILYPWIILI